MLGPLLSDLDGTIADTAPVIFASLRKTCEELEIDLTPEQEMSWVLGPPLHWCLEQLGVPDDVLPQAVEIFERCHTELMHMITPMPGADVVIRELADQGILVGIATIKPQYAAELVLETLGIRDLVHSLHGRTDDADPRTKTDLLRLARDELAGDHPLYVGDHSNDEIAAGNLDIPFLWHPENSWDVIRAAVLGLASHEADELIR
ncbi:MAG: HAD hydrolase-like protein [Actinomycetota bacterium]